MVKICFEKWLYKEKNKTICIIYVICRYYIYIFVSYVFPINIAITLRKSPMFRQHPWNLTTGCPHLNGPKYSKQASDLHQQWTKSSNIVINYKNMILSTIG